MDLAVLHALLCWEHAPPLGAEERRAMEGDRGLTTGELPQRATAPAAVAARAPCLSFISSSLTPPLRSVTYWPSSCSVRDVGGAVVRATAGPAEVAKQGSPPANGAARIGMVISAVDCRWSQGGAGRASATPPLAPGEPIFAGRRITLVSGLLEIMYDYRGEVILQGPADYTVESADTGFVLGAGDFGW